MKITINIIRIFTGLLFVFSGVIKAIDPIGLSYKMQEFFEAWASDGFLPKLMQSLGEHVLSFSLLMITLEVVLGVALLVGWQKKLTVTFVFLLMLFFTFLTAYVLYSGKVRACGCFGDCIPLTPNQTFTKDIILLVFAFLLLLKNKDIPVLSTALVRFLIVLLAMLCTVFLQLYVLKHLPLADCLPFKKGNNILELQKMPADAVADEYAYNFVYEKNGQKKSYDVNSLPDSTWIFVERKQTLVKSGSNNVPLISDFSFTNADGTDVTKKILSADVPYLLLFMKHVPDDSTEWVQSLKNLLAQNATTPFYVVTSYRTKTEDFLKSNSIKFTEIFVMDATAIKTAARTNPTMYRMKGAVIKNKKSWADFKTL